MGRKGRETRCRLQAAMVARLTTSSLFDIKAADLARDAGISPATFYVYFENVEQLVLSLAVDAVHDASGLLDIARAPWSMSADDGMAEAFTASFFDFWDRNRPVLRVRNLAAEEGKKDFIAARLQLSEPLHKALGAKVRRAQAAGRVSSSLHDLTQVSVALASLERSAANYPTYPARFGVSRARLLASSSALLKAALLGHAPR